MENTKQAASPVAWPSKESFQWACSWALNASWLQFFRAGLGIGRVMVLPDLELLTPGQAANVLAIHDATLWFSVAGVAAAVVAMVLEGQGRARRFHRALACVALASAVAIHCVLASFLGLILVTATTNNELVVGGVMAAAVVVFFAAFDAKAAAIVLGRPA